MYELTGKKHPFLHEGPLVPKVRGNSVTGILYILLIALLAALSFSGNSFAIVLWV